MEQARAVAEVDRRWRAANEVRNRRIRRRKIAALEAIYGPLSARQTGLLERLRERLEDA